MGQKKLGWGNFLLLLPDRVRSASLVWFCISKISPKNPKFLKKFPLGSKKNLIGMGQIVSRSKMGQPALIYCGSKVCSGLDRAHLYLKHFTVRGG